MSELIKTTWGKLGVLFDGPHATPGRIDEGPYFLNIASLKSGRLDLAESDHVSPEDFAKWTRRVTPREGDLLFSYETRLGEAALMPAGVSACLGRRMALLRPDRRVIDPRFLLYYFLSPNFQKLIQERAIHGATVDRIGLTTMPDWPVTIPGLPAQKATADVLSALDAKVEANRKTAALAERFISATYSRAIDADASPRGLLDALHVDFGEAFKGASFSIAGTGRPLIRIRDLKTMNPQVWTVEHRSREIEVQPGDVVVGMDAEFRASWWLGRPGMLNQRVCRVSCPNTGSAFVAESLRKPLALLEGEKTATTVIHLNKSDLARSVILWPSVERLAAFEAAAEPLLRQRVALAQESARLAATRDELLPLLMSGRVTVRDAERVAGSVT